MQAKSREVLSIGWFGEMFAREKRLEPLKKYLRKSQKRDREQGAQSVSRMFERMIERQANGTR